jgi:hypothetical protein
MANTTKLFKIMLSPPSKFGRGRGGMVMTTVSGSKELPTEEPPLKLAVSGQIAATKPLKSKMARITAHTFQDSLLLKRSSPLPYW